MVVDISSGHGSLDVGGIVERDESDVVEVLGGAEDVDSALLERGR